MRQLLFSAFLLITASGFSQKVVTKYYDYSSQKKEEYQVDAQGVMNGFYKNYLDDGRLIKHYNYLNGIEHGSWIEYYGTGPKTNGFVTCFGKPMLERQYDKGKILWEKDFTCVDNLQVIETKRELLKDGTYKLTTYYPNGKPEEVRYQSDYVGYATGDFISYHEDGKIAVKGQYKDGRQMGRWYAFYSKGDTFEVTDYFHDLVLYSKSYSENKKLTQEKKLSDDYETFTQTDYDESGNKTRVLIARAKPMKNDFVCKGKKFNSWKEYILESGECTERNIYAANDNVLLTQKINFKDGQPTDTIKKFLGMCCDTEKEYLNVQNYEYVVVMGIPCEHCRSQRCFETTQEEIDKLRASSAESLFRTKCSRLSEEVYNLRNQEVKLSNDAPVYSAWLNKVKSQIYDDLKPKYNEANQAYQKFREGGQYTQAYLDACTQFKGILESILSIYDRCAILDKEASPELKDSLKKATTVEEKKKLLGIK